jgi:hypothetical protein
VGKKDQPGEQVYLPRIRLFFRKISQADLLTWNLFFGSFYRLHPNKISLISMFPNIKEQYWYAVQVSDTTMMP